MQHIFEYLINRKLTAKDYNHKLIPTDEIWYEAAEKLDEVTANEQYGLHINSFNCNIINHTFNNGKGVIEFKDDVNEIGKYAFYACDKVKELKSITIPNSVKHIKSNAFFGCDALTKITIPNSVRTIENGAFGYCSKLTSITIPDSVTNIGRAAFWYCRGLIEINIPNSVTNIGNGAFYNCSKLTSINIPNSVTRIENETFEECSRLTEINIPDSVTSIGEMAFCRCGGLIKVTIPNSVTGIDDYAFSECTKLQKIIYNGTIKEWISIKKSKGKHSSWNTDGNPDCIIKCTDGEINMEDT